MPTVKTENKPLKTVKPEVTQVAKPVKKALSGAMYNLKGEVSGEFELPKTIFGQKVNKILVSQALRVYQANQSGQYGHTKTRGEVAISTRKIYKQKGTGGARHGAKSAPLFVGGGVAFGPRTRRVVLELPKKMARAALISVLSQKAESQKIVIVQGLEKASGKSKEMASLVEKIGGKKLSVVAESNKDGMVNAYRASANLSQVSFELADQLNVLRVLSSDKLVLTPEAVTKLVTRLGKEGK